MNLEIQAKATKTHKSRRRLAFARPLCSLIVQQRHGQAALTRLRCLTPTHALTLLVAHDSLALLSSAVMLLASQSTATDPPKVGRFLIHFEPDEAWLLLCMQSASISGNSACLASVTFAHSHKHHMKQSLNAVQPLGRPDLMRAKLASCSALSVSFWLGSSVDRNHLSASNQRSTACFRREVPRQHRMSGQDVARRASCRTA